MVGYQRALMDDALKVGSYNDAMKTTSVSKIVIGGDTGTEDIAVF